MLIEAVATPKPGLVDMCDQGAHSDMDLYTFIDSSFELFRYMYGFAEIGWNFDNKDLRQLFFDIRELGLSSERDMLRVTGGANTQKGLNFSLGCICASSGYLLSNNKELNAESITDTVSKMTEGLCERELEPLLKKEKPKEELTAGEKLFIEYGVKGIRGEAESGFISAVTYGLPILSKAGRLSNEVVIDALLNLMENVVDTNVLHRCGDKGLELMRKSAGYARQLGGIKTEKGKEHLRCMNKQFIDCNISPGGCADLLAISIMLYLLCNETWSLGYQ